MGVYIGGSPIFVNPRIGFVKINQAWGLGLRVPVSGGSCHNFSSILGYIQGYPILEDTNNGFPRFTVYGHIGLAGLGSLQLAHEQGD